MWLTVERLLEHGRSHHTRHYSEQRCVDCLLCPPPQHRPTRRIHVKSKSIGGSGLGCVDFSFETQSQQSLLGNGHPYFSDPYPRPTDHETHATSTRCHRYPHILAYYEIDAKKWASLTSQKSKKKGVQTNPICPSLENLRTAISHLSVSKFCRVPATWISLAELIQARTNFPGRPSILHIDQVRALAKDCDVNISSLRICLHHLHRIGRLIHFEDSNSESLLSKYVVCDVAWFEKKMQNFYDAVKSSCLSVNEALLMLKGKDVDAKDKDKTQMDSTQQATFLLELFNKLEICVPLEDEVMQTKRASRRKFDARPRMLLVPALLKYGCPSHDVWPDNPEWEERQITCDFVIRCLKPYIFNLFIIRLVKIGRHTLKVRIIYQSYIFWI